MASGSVMMEDVSLLSGDVMEVETVWMDLMKRIAVGILTVTMQKNCSSHFALIHCSNCLIDEYLLVFIHSFIHFIHLLFNHTLFGVQNKSEMVNTIFKRTCVLIESAQITAGSFVVHVLVNN